MKTRYKIPLIAFSVLVGILFIPLIASNLYCDFLGDSCHSRIIGVGPGGVYLPAEWGTVDNCWKNNDDGTLEPCRIDIAQITWPYTPLLSIHELQCDEICLDEHIQKDKNILVLEKNDTFTSLAFIDPDYPLHNESLSIKFSPLYYEDMEFSFDWCIQNNGFWNEDDSTCYFETQKDLEQGMVAVNDMMAKNLEN